MSILVVDGDDGCRKQVTSLLGRIGHSTLEAKNGRQALDVAKRERPDLVLLEVNLAEVSGYEVCRELRDSFGHAISIIFLSGARTESFDRVAGLLLGADDYIVKPFDPDELLARVRSSLRSGRTAASSDAPGSARELTAREREILSLLARGLDQVEIAARLVISPKTVGTHIQRVLTKLGVHSRAQAVALAHEQGLAETKNPAFSVGFDTA